MPMTKEEFKEMLKEVLAESLEVALSRTYGDGYWSSPTLTVELKFDKEVITQDYCTVPKD